MSVLFSMRQFTIICYQQVTRLSSLFNTEEQGGITFGRLDSVFRPSSVRLIAFSHLHTFKLNFGHFQTQFCTLSKQEVCQSCFRACKASEAEEKT